MEELKITLENLLRNRSLVREHFSKTIQLQWSEIAAPVEDPFLQTALQHIRQRLKDPDFGVEELANAMRISRVQLFNRIKSLTSVPPANLIRTIRLENAKRLLEKGEGNISEVAYKVGFDNPNYFGKAFKKHFGVPPSAVLQQ